MSTIDIRDMHMSTIDVIQFADSDTDAVNVTPCYVAKDINCVVVLDEDRSDYLTDCGTRFRILNKEHAQNMIKALEKAVELGWLE